MPAGPGESLVATLFADVHYYFTDPAANPPHHRFDRGSYVYLFHNPTQQQGKLEVANKAGTADQDAFHGSLSVASLQYSHLQPSLVTLLLNTHAITDHSTWHLPTYNERNEQKYLYKLHAVDIYLWTEKDASSLVAHLKTILAPDKLDIKNAPRGNTPHSEHRDSMSPVVQQLENTAIGTHFPPRAASTVSAQSVPGLPTPMSSQAPPPAAPMGYNPAAPPAPEPVAYREKTPPPPDDGTGTGLKHAAVYDHIPQQPQFASTPSIYQTTPQSAYFSGPPQHQATPFQPSFPGPPGGMPPPPQQQQQQRTPSFGPMATSTLGGPQSPPPTQASFGPMAPSTLPQSPPPDLQSFHRQSSFGGPPNPQHTAYNPQTQYPTQPANSQLPPTPSAPPAYSASFPPPPPVQQPPVGGYSNYSYAAAQASPGALNQHGAYIGDVHSQIYRPSEAEAGGHGHSKPKTGGSGQPSKLQEQVGKAEGKFGKLLGRLDKLY